MKKTRKKLMLSMQTIVTLTEPRLAEVAGGVTQALSQCGHCPPSKPVSVCTC
jgi:hypothetical protein